MYDPLQDIQQYAPNLTISQVVKFFEKKELGITRPMIQNYIRDGVLPPAVNKRYYTHRHLAALVLIDYLKTIFEIGDIRKALAPLMEDDGLPLPAYKILMQYMEHISVQWREQVAPAIFNQETATQLSALLLMVHAADLKALAAAAK